MKRFLPLLILFLLIHTATKGTHLMGSEITYVRTGNKTYDVYIKIYRDCNGIAISQSNLIAKSGSQSLSFSNQSKLSVRDVTGTEGCMSASKCSGGTYQFGVEEHLWKVVVDLSAYQDCEWEFSWEQTARNSNISTGAANQTFFVTAMLNSCVANSSPAFSVLPIRFLCQNTDVIYNMGLTDTVDQGDSFSFQLVDALQSANQSVSYSGNFSATSPLNYYGFPNSSMMAPAGFHLNPLTGDLYFRPTMANQVAIIVIEVSEWRTVNGVKTVIGKTRRDMQVIVLNCASQNEPPSLDGPVSYEVCAGDSISLPFFTSDPDSGDSTYIYRYGSSVGTFVHNNGQGQNATGYLQWKTSAGDVATNPYIVTLNIKDNGCPLNAEISKSILIFVRDSNSRSSFRAGPDRQISFLTDSFPVLGIDSFINGQQAYWQTTGDGYFHDSTAAITYYVLGTNDKSACSFYLIRTPLTTYSCGSTEPDSALISRPGTWLQLSISMDSIQSDSIFLQIINPFTGPAQWNSNGSGTWVVDSVNHSAIYIPSAADFSAGTVTLGASQQGPCNTATGQEVIALNNLWVRSLQGRTLNVYPNPSSGILTIETPEDWHPTQVLVYDMAGRVLVQAPWGGETSTRIDLGRLSPGTYVLVVKNSFGERKLIHVSMY